MEVAVANANVVWPDGNESKLDPGNALPFFVKTSNGPYHLLSSKLTLEYIDIGL